MKTASDRSASLYQRSMSAGSLFGGIIFDLKQGKVSEIFIGAAAE